MDKNGFESGGKGKSNSTMSREFPQLCKWNGFTIDSPMTGWEYGGNRRENFCHSGREQGKLQNERSDGSVGGCRRPVPHSADGGLIARNYRRNGSARDGRGPQRATAGRQRRSQGRAWHPGIIKCS